MNIDKNTLEQLNQAFLEIQMPRTPYILENMVVNSRFTEEQRYAQCVLEMSIAYDNLRIVECDIELKKLEISELNEKSEKDMIIKRKKEIELEQTQRAMLGALREFTYLFEIWQRFPKKFTREELNNAQSIEFQRKLEIQAQQDLNATGRISQGNQEGLRQIGRVVYPQLDISREVEKRFLDGGKCRILLAVATEHRAENGLPCIEGLEYPNGVEVKIFNCWGRKVADAYNEIFRVALEDKADYIVTIEDDNFPPKDAIIRLLSLVKENPKSCAGGWYPKKEESLQGVHIELSDNMRRAMDADGTIKKAYTMAMGCSIYPIEAIMSIDYPYCITTPHLSQDSYLSQLLREAGWDLLVDTSLRVKHICRITGKIYE